MPLSRCILLAMFMFTMELPCTATAFVSDSYFLPAGFTNPKYFLVVEKCAATLIINSDADSVSGAYAYHSIFDASVNKERLLRLPRDSNNRRRLIRAFMDDSDLILFTNNDILFASSKNGAGWITDSTKRIPLGISGAYVDDQHIYLWDEIAEGIPIGAHWMKMCAYDRKTHLFSTIEILHPVHGWPYAYIQPRRVISMKDSCIVISNLSRYNVTVSDVRTGQLDTLNGASIQWTQPGIDLVDSLDMSHDAQANFPLINATSKKRSLIISATLIKDNHLVVFRSEPDTSTRNQYQTKLFLDVWNRQIPGWNCAASALQIFPALESMPYSLGVAISWKKIALDDKRFVTFTTYASDWPLDRVWNSHKEFLSEIDSYAINHTIRYVATYHEYPR